MAENTPNNSFLSRESLSDVEIGITPNFDKGLLGSIRSHIDELVANTASKSFPVHAFPSRIQRIISELNRCLLFPVDYTGAASLAAFSAAIGNSFMLENKKGFNSGAVLYIALVGKPGVIKTHALKAILSPIDKRDGVSYKEYEKRLTEYEQAISMTKKEREENNVSDLERPEWSHTLVQDATPEALLSCLRNNSRGLLLYKDELIGWVKNFNRYSSGSEQEFWLEAWNQGTISADRKMSRGVRISPAFITVTGTLQPAVLEELAKNSRSKVGFTDRILFAYPDGVKKESWNEKEINPDMLKEWENIINKMFDVQMTVNSRGESAPVMLPLDTDAKEILWEWVRMNTQKINTTFDERLEGVYIKLEAYSLRLSLILQLMRWACGEGSNLVVERESVEGALQLIEYFRGTAEKVYQVLFDSIPIDKEPVKVQNWYNKLNEQVTRKEAIANADSCDISKRTCDRLLNRKDLFTKVGHGIYEKLY
ncbi:DUF3987 domain-containing protein [Nafulsella turpanensis]|uniref:DUF3987 domain-containing protein n=1 Tax=Nafulsella turpanensis TaxID=1265690 RepID=UPI00034A6B6D|nr:DUF3987 domain-containing protein [Nafulsella turpanensis]